MPDPAIEPSVELPATPLSARRAFSVVHGQPHHGPCPARRRSAIWLMAGVVLLGAVARLWHLDAYGFSPDEINKWRAIEAYRHFDFSANAEHPMLMKLAAWASVAGTRRWNGYP